MRELDFVPTMPGPDSYRPEVVIPNLRRGFSGITSTIVQVLPHQLEDVQIALLGHPLPRVSKVPRIGFRELVRLARNSDQPIVFHARRNDDMIAGLVLKKILGCRLHLIFTSVAQREHSAFTRFLYSRMDTLLSTSEKSASYLLRKPDTIVPHGTDIETYRPASERAQEWAEGGLTGTFGVGIFGRVRPNKGHREFVDALCSVLPDYPDFTAVIIGETTPYFRPFVAELQASIDERGLSDRFAWLGKLPFSEIPVWFRRMSLVAAVPHTEGFGLTCLEAMASGVPVVATQTGGFEMVIRDGIDGKIVPCQDTGALSQAFHALLREPEKLEVMGQAARERIETAFTVEHEAAALTDIYRKARILT